jgi:erythromycin esterase-like protein
MSDSDLIHAIRSCAVPLDGSAAAFDGLLAMAADCPLVLLGEASHGTHEFYRQRALITRRLIEEHGFNAVAVEADWPDACRINRYVRGGSDDRDAVQALAGFERFPSWMWRNADVLDFIGWLRDHNDNAGSPDRQAGFYGLDLYSLHKSMDEVIRYLERIDHDAAVRARQSYGCLDRYGPDPQNYGLLTTAGVNPSCRQEVIRELVALRASEARYLARDGQEAADEFFFAEQNARLVLNAEHYYRAMFRPDVSSWNTRDEHMVETLVELLTHLRARDGRAKVVVWAHNSHLGDARATEMGRRGEINIGSRIREQFPGKCLLVGFTTHSGSVTAASGWHLPAEHKTVRPGLDGSYEKLFHQVGIPRFLLDLTAENPAVRALREPRLERAIGVIYQPETERRSHYFTACLPQQFDAVLHFDETRAVEPLDASEQWRSDEAAATYPAGR